MRARGCDASDVQAHIDFGAFAASGLGFMVLKATEGRFVDPAFAWRMAAARSAGVLVPMVYCVLGYAADVDEQVANVVRTVSFYDVDIMVDWETPAPAEWAAHGLSGTIQAARCRDFTKGIIAGTGRRVAVYNYPDFGSHVPDCPEVRELATMTDAVPAAYPDEKHWPAETAEPRPFHPAWAGRWRAWQCSGDGGTSLPGFGGQVVDHIVWNGSRDDMLAWMRGTKSESFPPDPPPEAA